MINTEAWKSCYCLPYKKKKVIDHEGRRMAINEAWKENVKVTSIPWLKLGTKFATEIPANYIPILETHYSKY